MLKFTLKTNRLMFSPSRGMYVGFGVTAGDTERATCKLSRQRLNIAIDFEFFNFRNIAIVTGLREYYFVLILKFD